MAVFIFTITFIYSILITPLGHFMGLRERKPIHLQESPLLESVYKKYALKVPNEEMKVSNVR